MLTIYKLQADHTIDFAAEELKKYMRMMMPETGDIIIAYNPDAKDGFRLGLLEDFDLPFTGTENDLDDEYYINMDVEGGYIAGSNPRSVLFGIYRYLKKLGVRFMFPGAEGEYVPLADITPVEYHKLADHRIRGHALEGDPSLQHVLDYIDYMAKQELNNFGGYGVVNYQRRYYLHRYNEKNRPPESLSYDLSDRQWRALYESEVRKRGLRLSSGGHKLLSSALGLDPADRYAYKDGTKKLEPGQEVHMALIKGKRGLHRNDPDFTNICMSQPAARRKVIDKILEWFEENPDKDSRALSLADTTHNHCECDQCQKMRPSDWLMVMCNELDEEMTKRGMKQRIAFSSYIDTVFAPTQMKIKNPTRFSLSFCPISRNYLTSITEDTVLPETKPYIRNAWEAPQTMEDYVAHFKEWEYAYKGTRMTYEYHYWKPQFRDPGMQFFSRRIYEDTLSWNVIGTHGCMEDGSNRSFWPNGFHDYIYNETLMNRDLDYEAEYADYYEHAYGKDWEVVKKYLEGITEAFNYPYMVGADSADREKGDYYNPAMAERLANVKELAATIREAYKAHTDMPTRVQQVYWRIIRLHADYCQGLAEVLTEKCLGHSKVAEEKFRAFMDEFGKHDFELDRYFDFGLAADSIYKIVVAKTRNKLEVL